jgi:hypothetical protein
MPYPEYIGQLKKKLVNSILVYVARPTGVLLEHVLNFT